MTTMSHEKTDRGAHIRVVSRASVMNTRAWSSLASFLHTGGGCALPVSTHRCRRPRPACPTAALPSRAAVQGWHEAIDGSGVLWEEGSLGAGRRRAEQGAAHRMMGSSEVVTLLKTRLVLRSGHDALGVTRS